MFLVATFIGLYSYFIFFLGIFGLLTKINVQILTIVFIILIILYKRSVLYKYLNKIKSFQFNEIKKQKPVYLLLFLIILQALVNLIGALGPELAFDALWYHLTLPSLFLLHRSIYHIPGGLLYYSDMPKLVEMLYIGALSFGSEILPKLIHYFFGLLCALTLFAFSRKFFSKNIAALIVVIFYSNLVVDWESITAYIDLVRTFFEFLSLWGIINWYESKKSTWLVVSGIMMGLAITTKVLAIGSYLLFIFLILAIFITKQKSIKETFYGLVIFSSCALIVPLPWFIFSFFNTGNPVYPFFTKTYEISANSPNPLMLVSDLWNLFIHSADPISPLYLIFLPLLVIFYTNLRKEMKIIVWYSGLCLILLYFTPRTGGGRFILPYLPAFSIICGAIYSEILKKTRTEWKYISKILFCVIVLVALISIGYRGIANKKYLPVILGQETKQSFLSNNLNYRFGDFYDTNDYFKTHINSNDTVLLYGFHNLYYVDFPFIDSTWVKKGDTFNYIAVQKSKLLPKYRDWQLVYSNDKTMVQLYKPPKGECNVICRY